jgi:hypothetical protein
VTWTDETWLGFCALLDEAWPGSFDPDAERAYRVLLDDLEPGAAIGALRRLLYGGQRFRPSVAELLAAIRKDPSRPTFEEAWTLIEESMGCCARGPFISEAAMHRADDVEFLRDLNHRNPLVRSFVERYGVRRIQELPINDPQWGEKTRRELREAWERHVEASEGREVAALASGEGREGLRQLDPLSALGANRRKEIEG